MQEKTFYEYVVDEIQRRYDNNEITYEQAVYADDKAYERYVIDPIINDITDEYDESTALSRHIYNNYEDKIKKLKDEKRKVDDQIKSLEQLHKTAKEGSNSKKSIEEKLKGLRNLSEHLEDRLADIIYSKRPDNDTKYAGKLKYDTTGKNAKQNIRKEYDTKPAAAPREPGLYKKIQDNK